MKFDAFVVLSLPDDLTASVELSSERIVVFNVVIAVSAHLSLSRPGAVLSFSGRDVSTRTNSLLSGHELLKHHPRRLWQIVTDLLRPLPQSIENNFIAADFATQFRNKIAELRDATS
jgi:hypothetical protein